VMRWERATQQETIEEPSSEDRPLLSVSSDGHWIARILDGVVSIRSVNGGDWKSLVSGVTIKAPPSSHARCKVGFVSDCRFRGSTRIVPRSHHRR
jgi:hypothetical protein